MRSATRPVFTRISSAGVAAAVDGRHEALADDAAQGAGERQPDLFLLMRREEVDHAVHGLGGILRVQGGHHEVSGFGGLQRRADRLGVAHLTDQDHVGVLAERGPERRQEVAACPARPHAD